MDELLARAEANRKLAEAELLRAQARKIESESDDEEIPLSLLLKLREHLLRSGSAKLPVTSAASAAELIDRNVDALLVKYAAEKLFWRHPPRSPHLFTLIHLQELIRSLPPPATE